MSHYEIFDYNGLAATENDANSAVARALQLWRFGHHEDENADLSKYVKVELVYQIATTGEWMREPYNWERAYRELTSF